MCVCVCVCGVWGGGGRYEVGAVAKLLGGTYFQYVLKGDVALQQTVESVPAEEQLQALEKVSEGKGVADWVDRVTDRLTDRTRTNADTDRGWPCLTSPILLLLLSIFRL